MKTSRPLVALLLTGGLATAATDLVSNVKLEARNDAGNGPADWGVGGAVRWAADETGNHFLRIVCAEPGKMAMLYREFDLPEGTVKIAVSFRARVSGLVAGEQPWFDARLIHKLRTPEGDRDVAPVFFNRDTDGWVPRETVFDVPAGATKYIFMPSLFQAKAGTFDLDDIRVTALKEDESVPSTLPQAKAPRPFPTCELKPLADADTPVVDGPQLRTRDGRELWLQGVAIPSLEWTVSGDHMEESFAHAIADWRANVIRLPLKSLYWFGEADKDFNRRSDGGAGYRALVDRLVDYANERGCYVVLDLHEYKAPTAKHARFWKSAAAHFANRPGVIFDLLNEPHGISWDEWRNGGELKAAGGADAVAENNEAKDVNASIGMQELVRVVRSTGANNVLLCGGLDWAYDLSGILKGYELEDTPEGNGIMYSAHIYPWKSDWQGKVLDIAAKHPVLCGEVGCQVKPMPFEQSAKDPYAWAPDMLACIQKHRLHWTAWSFHPGASPCVLADWDYTPTPYWGAFVRAALRGATFESDRLR